MMIALVKTLRSAEEAKARKHEKANGEKSEFVLWSGQSQRQFLWAREGVLRAAGPLVSRGMGEM